MSKTVTGEVENIFTQNLLSNLCLPRLAHFIGWAYRPSTWSSLDPSEIGGDIVAAGLAIAVSRRALANILDKILMNRPCLPNISQKIVLGLRFIQLLSTIISGFLFGFLVWQNQHYCTWYWMADCPAGKRPIPWQYCLMLTTVPAPSEKANIVTVLYCVAGKYPFNCLDSSYT